MTPKFSVIIPVYNVAPYLRECLDSVLAQTFTDWEAICVDDGSTDGSGEILDGYAVKDARFRVIHQKNDGVSAARNTALEAALGDLVMFLDADDLWLSRTLLSRIVLANETADGRSLVSFGCKKFEVTLPQIAGSCRVDIVDISRLIPELIWGKLFGQFAYPADLIARLRFGRRRIAEDMHFMFEAVGHADRIYDVDVCGYGYRMRADSASHSVYCINDIRSILEMFRLWLSGCGNRKKNLSKRALYVTLRSIKNWLSKIYWKLPLMDRVILLPSFARVCFEATFKFSMRSIHG